MRTILSTILLTLSCSVFATDSDIVTVKGKGVGVNEAAALKDAYRDAVETAVGLYIDAEQMVKNDEVVEDKILTQSNAYIESYDILKKSMANGLCKIKILAKVKTKALTKTLSSTMKTQTVEVGSGLRNLYASETTKKKSGEDGAALLKNVLDKLDPIKCMIDVALAEAEPIVFNKNDDASKELKMAYLFKQTISEERYFSELMPQLRDVLTQITLSGPEKMTLNVSDREPFCLSKSLGGHPRESVKHINYLQLCRCRADVSSSELGKMSGYCGSSMFEEQGKAYVILVINVNKLHTIYTCEKYELDKYAAKVFSGWRSTRIFNAKDPFVNVAFVDGDGEDLVQKSVVVDRPQNLTCCAMRSFARGGSQNFFVFAPWFLDGDSSYFERYVWREVSVPKDALPLIKQIKVDLVK